MAYTIYDIAKKANTSPSTVSRYINNKPVKPDTYIRIKQAIEEMGFQPNAMARALVYQTIKTIAIFTTDIRVPNYAKTVYTMEQEFTKLGYHVIICNISNNVEKTNEYLRMFSDTKLDGICFIGSIFNELNSNEETLKLLSGLPVVVANGKLNISNCYSIFANDENGIEQAVDYLVLTKKRKKIFYIKDLDTTSAKRKVDGFVKEMTKLGLYNDSLILNCQHSLEGGVSIVDYLIKNNIDFDGIITGEDIVAVGIVNTLKEIGYAIFNEVDVIGFNNTIYSEITSPKLTVIDNRAEYQGRCLVKMLDDLINKKDVNDIYLDLELVKKGSA